MTLTELYIGCQVAYLTHQNIEDENDLEEIFPVFQVDYRAGYYREQQAVLIRNLVDSFRSVFPNSSILKLSLL